MELDCDRAVRSLNGMFSHAPQPALGQGAPACAFVSRAQREAIDFVEESVRALGAPPPGLTPAEALRKLRVASWYDVDSAKLGSYRPDAISLPSGAVRPIPLETLWGSGGSDTVKDFISQNLLCSERAKQRLQGVGLERAYSDPALRLSLCTGDALSRLELGLNDELHIQGADLSDAFYHMGLPEELRGYFSFRPVRASAVGIKLLGGEPLGRGALVTPRLAVLPMGWSWALWWCQRVHERTSVEAGACPEQRIVDHRPPPPMTPGAHLEYVDNFIAIGTDSEWVAALVRRVSDALRARGLEVKAEDHAGELPGESEALGWCIDRGRCIVRPTRARLWRARLAVRGVLGRGRLRGRDLEKLLGHLVFISLIKREGMSLFWSCYAFVRKCYDKETGLWPAVRRELEYWDGIAPLLWRSLRSPWTDELIVVDASEWGIGACAAPAPASLVQRLGHVSERWRWHHGLAGSAPRRHAGAAAAAAALAGDPADAAPWMLGAEAVAAAGFPPRHAGGDGLGGEDSALHSHNPQTQAAGAAEGAAGSAFDEVPPDVIKLPWRTVGRHRWRWPEESMPVAEARAVLHGLQHLVRASRHRGRRVVVLGDSLSAAGAVDRFRSSSCKMLRVTQAIAAVTLVTATTLHYRWLPSEWNAADNPSRGRFSPSTPQPLLPRAKSGAAGPGAAGPPGKPADVGAGAAARGAAARPDGLGDADPVYVQASGDVEAASRPRKRRRVAATAAAAARRRSAAVQLPGLSVLETGSITAATRAQYVEAFDGFQAWMAERGVQPTTLDDYDEQLVLRLDELYLDGEGIGAGQKLFASLLAALVSYLVSVSKLEAALVLWLSFELYLRPSEPYHIRATDLVRPARGRLGHDSWSVTLHAAETEVLSKTAEYDEALKLDLPRQELLGPALEASREVSSALSAAAKAFGIEKFLPGLHPYMLRHGGASHDYGSKARSLVDVQRRGRWQSWHSVRRYEKGARLSQVLQMVPAAMQDHAARCADSLGEITRFFLEVFSGSGRLGRAVAAEGLPVLLWDICLGPEYDLLSPQKRGLIRSWVRSGLVIGIHIGTPCNTWSRARDIPPGPMPLRSDAFPLGLPDLSVKDQAKVDAGNVFMIFSAGLMHEAIRANIPASNENPQTSRLWLAPPFVRLLRSSAVTFTITHFCQWGAPWRKATAFATASGPLRDPRQTAARLGDAAARVAAGRAATVLQELMECSLRCPKAASVTAPPSHKLAAGVSARLCGADGFVLSVCTRWRVPRADVVPLHRDGDGRMAPNPEPIEQCRSEMSSTECERNFPVEDADVRRVFPGILINHPPRSAPPIYMTAAFLTFAVQNFYEELNTRAVSHGVLSLYAANALSLQLGSGAVPAVTAVPPAGALRAMLQVVLGNFLDKAVIRGDGNFKLAKRVCHRVRGSRFHLRPFTIVSAWTGTDGSLLMPVTLKRGETVSAIVEDLSPLLDSIKAARLAADLPPKARAPVFHATDYFRSHRVRFRALCRQKWPERNLGPPKPEWPPRGTPAEAWIPNGILLHVAHLRVEVEIGYSQLRAPPGLRLRPAMG
ncbi:unnamed protein product [Prorocentrum cordatum]|uniref:Reverse transcriptase domain-containing protein n=1 Tax=Prorocentrum cordatum TaxID=2364126 RepID=A0ABN9S6P6_9DINO|nr:unnamed protein product [Polarella glacialis]